MSADPFANPHTAARSGQIQSPFGQPAAPAAPGFQPGGFQQPQPAERFQQQSAPSPYSPGFAPPPPQQQQQPQSSPFSGGFQPQQPQQPQQLHQRHPQAGQPQQGQQPGDWSQFAPSDPMLRSAAMLGMNQAQQAVQSGLTRYMPGMALFWSTLKYHFNVNNKYVLTKLRLLLFPFRHASWARERAQGGEFAPPIADINAPDLYIPTMAFLTYVLLVGLVKGTRMKFTPEVITDTFYATLLTQFVEVFFMKVGTYMLPAGAAVSIALTDLVVYSSYIYVGLVVDLLAGLFLGSAVYYAMLLYTAACMAWFMYFTMEHTVPLPGMNDLGRKRRLYFLITCAGIQAMSMWYMGWSREILSSEDSVAEAE